MPTAGRVPNSVSVNVRGERLALLPQRAAWWPARETLVVADIHLGKSETYRALGVPIPAGIGEEALARLVAVCEACAARRLVILGDLVHSAAGLTPAVRAAMTAARSRLPKDVLLVRGNHDAAIDRLPVEWNLTVVGEPHRDGSLAFLHHPAGVRDHYALAGHLHPTYTIASAHDVLRLPCFHFGPRIGVLPAFSAFTRGVPMTLEPGDSVLVIAEGEVVPVTPEPAP